MTRTRIYFACVNDAEIKEYGLYVRESGYSLERFEHPGDGCLNDAGIEDQASRGNIYMFVWGDEND